MTESAADEARVAIVTGAARRIGAELARHLHRRGLRVMIHCHRSEDEARALAGRLNAQRPDSAAVVQADLADSAAPQRIVEYTLAQFGRIDILINNASSFYPTPPDRAGMHHWEDLMASNLRAPFWLSLACARQMQEGSAIVNLVDIHGIVPLKGHAIYSQAKAGLIMQTRALAKDLAPAIRVNAVAPGSILWPEHGHDDSEAAREVLERVPMRRQGRPEDIAGAVAFLALDAPYVTGQVLAVDGGRLLNM
ncbi:MAG: pteridine reductase [Wenzhouxiangellaceae bacterium]